ncbi:hypothetical protein AAEO56_19215 [Flavobacterium sp. DGU11]|uniref:Uncharacterized protein n=1 Tax=Flavobacterium arundinis TaxID=3139143 RepID=A0ABU9I3L3_9FLAO
MKKLFLFICLSVSVLFFTACSNNDDSPSGNRVSFKINGVQKTFRGVAAIGESDNGGATILYHIKAATDANSAEIISFYVPAGTTGANMAYSFDYVTDNTLFTNNGVSSNVTVNSNKKMKGSFSGSVVNDAGQVKTITDGTFDIDL